MIKIPWGSWELSRVLVISSLSCESILERRIRDELFSVILWLNMRIQDIQIRNKHLHLDPRVAYGFRLTCPRMTNYSPSFSGLTRESRTYTIFYMKYSIRAFQPCTYIMASDKNGTLYIGVTSDLVKRVFEHKNHHFEWFTDEYDIINLVYYECHDTMASAIQREKNLKHWMREWKIALIEEGNPMWKDLYDNIV